MKLLELEGHFVRLSLGPPEEHWPLGRPSHAKVESILDADGVFFLCPKCFAANAGPIGTHAVICWFSGHVPDWIEPGPGRWNPAGTGIENLTFVEPGAVSVALRGGCEWHGFVRDGGAE